MQGVKVRPEVLREARTHVLDPATPLPHAEDTATHLTDRAEAWVARVRGKPWSDPKPTDWEPPPRGGVCEW